MRALTKAKIRKLRAAGKYDGQKDQYENAVKRAVQRLKKRGAKISAIKKPSMFLK